MLEVFGACVIKNWMQHGISFGAAIAMVILMSGCAGPSGAPLADASGGGRNIPRESVSARTSCRSPIDQVRSDLKEVALALGLTPIQVPLWEAYEDSTLALASAQFQVDPGPALGRSASQQIAAKVVTAHAEELRPATSVANGCLLF